MTGPGELHGVWLAELGHAPEYQTAERGDAGHGGPLVLGGDLRAFDAEFWRTEVP
jgi:hypothetical protein